MAQGNRPSTPELVGFAAHFGIDFDTVYSFTPPTKEEMRSARIWKRKAVQKLPGSGRYVPYAGPETLAGGISGEGHLDMGFIQVMDVESGEVVATMGVAYFQQHSQALGKVEPQLGATL